MLNRTVVRLATLAVTVLGGAVLAVALLQAAGGFVKVDADPKNITQNPNKPFDPNNPPPGTPPGHAAFTDCSTEVKCSAKTDNKVTDEPYAGGCVVEVTVKSVDVKVTLSITTFLVPGEGAVLVAHEAGHVEICKDAWKLVAKKITEDVFKAFPKSFKINVAPCTPEEVTKQSDAAIKALCDGLGQQAAEKIDAEIMKPGQDYDNDTGNGTKAPDGSPPTPKNQGDAAKQSFQDYKKEFEKPKPNK